MVTEYEKSEMGQSSKGESPVFARNHKWKQKVRKMQK